MCVESTLALYVNYAKETGKKLKSVDSNNADEKTTIIPWGTRKSSNSNITNSNRGETPQEETRRAPPGTRRGRRRHRPQPQPPPWTKPCRPPSLRLRTFPRTRNRRCWCKYSTLPRFTYTLFLFLFNCRNLANHLYSKVYETQEDLCRKRNEIRLANLQLASVRAQVSGRLRRSSSKQTTSGLPSCHFQW